MKPNGPIVALKELRLNDKRNALVPQSEKGKESVVKCGIRVWKGQISTPWSSDVIMIFFKEILANFIFVLRLLVFGLNFKCLINYIFDEHFIILIHIIILFLLKFKFVLLNFTLYG